MGGCDKGGWGGLEAGIREKSKMVCTVGWKMEEGGCGMQDAK